jgi:uncharacterized protein YhfF
MPIHDGVLRFGYPGDAGVGATLESMVIAGTKTATCLPTGELTPADAAETLGSSGRTIDIVDWHDRLRCRVVVTAAYEATFRDPTLALLIGEGYGEDLGSFQRDHVAAPAIADHPDRAESLGSIPAPLAAIVERHDVRGESTTAIAGHLDLPLQQVRQRLRRGRVRLAAVLDDRAGLAKATWSPSSTATWASDEHLDRCEYCGRLLADRPSSAPGPRQPDELDLAVAVVCFRLAD